VANHRARDRREARRRQHQHLVAQTRRAERRRRDEVREAAEAKLAELAARAADAMTEPAAVAELATALVADPLVGRLLGRPAFGFQTASSLVGADDEGAEDADDSPFVVGQREEPEDAALVARRMALAEALTVAAEDHPALVWMAAGAWDAAGETDRAEAIVASVVAGVSPRDEAYRAGAALLASLRIQLGRVADALDFLLEAAAQLPDQEDIHLLSAIALGLAWRSLSVPGEDPCACGSNKRAGSCCQPRITGLLARFDDRSRVDRLLRAMRAWVAIDPGRKRLLDAEAEAFGEELLGALGEEPGALEQTALLNRYRRLGEQRAWLVAGDDDDAGDEATLLGQFARDPSTSSDLATDASAWLDHTTYGLWQVADPKPAPGVWLLDLLTGRRLFASLSADRLEGLARWSVLLGPVVCIDGIWRTTEGMALLAPAEADDLAALVDELFEELDRALAEEAGIKPGRQAPRDPDPLPAGVVAGLADPVDDTTALALGRLVCAALGTLLGQVEAGRRRAPTMCNTDGDPIEILEARIATERPDSVREGLLERDDFEADDDRLLWYGRELSATEREASMAKAREEALERGWSEPEEPETPRRWVRATMRFEGRDLLIEVNSKRGLDRLGEIVRSLGVADEPRIARRVDPTLDLPAPRGPLRTGRSMGREAEAAWRASWLDEPVPALGGLSPRRAANDPRGRVRLEGLLRTFEHDGDLSLSEGIEPLDVDALREALGLAEGL